MTLPQDEKPVERRAFFRRGLRWLLKPVAEALDEAAPTPAAPAPPPPPPPKRASVPARPAPPQARSRSQE